jgi:hypothetical protein
MPIIDFTDDEIKMIRVLAIITRDRSYHKENKDILSSIVDKADNVL